MVEIGCAAIPTARRELGQAVWLLLLLRGWEGGADRFVRSGASIRAAELAAEMGVGERQARRELQRLRRVGYVELENTGRGYRIRLGERQPPVGSSA